MGLGTTSSTLGRCVLLALIIFVFRLVALAVVAALVEAALVEAALVEAALVEAELPLVPVMPLLMALAQTLALAQIHLLRAHPHRVVPPRRREQ